jgi:DNA-binding MarR family transcriptional regulator
VTDEPLLPLWTLVQTAHLASRRFAEVFADAGLTRAEFAVLACVADGDDLSKADVARAILLRPQSVARVVDALVAAGLLTRDGSGGRGRRSGHRLTDQGWQVLARARAAVRTANEPDQLGLTGPQADDLVRALETVRAQLARTLSDAADGDLA